MKNIRFTNNKIINPIPIKKIVEDRYNGVVHLVCTRKLVISDNVFEITDPGAKREVWIQVANDTNVANDYYKNENLTANNITIKNNKYVSKSGKTPKKFIRLLG